MNTFNTGDHVKCIEAVRLGGWYDMADVIPDWEPDMILTIEHISTTSYDNELWIKVRPLDPAVRVQNRTAEFHASRFKKYNRFLEEVKLAVADENT